MNVNLSSQYPSGLDACGSSPVRPYLPVMEETGFDEAWPFQVGAGGGRMGLGKIFGGNQMDEGCVFYAVFFIFDFFSS
jgi:hypothetical protein